MAKLETLIHSYATKANLLVEQPPGSPIPADPVAGAAPAPAPLPPGADPAMPAVHAPDAQVPEEEEGKTATIADQNYVLAVQDMLELLTIDVEALDDNELEVFEGKVNPKNAMKLHKKLRKIIKTHGSPTAPD